LPLEGLAGQLRIKTGVRIPQTMKPCLLYDNLKQKLYMLTQLSLALKSVLNGSSQVLL